MVFEQYHPDMNKGPGAEDKFKEISAAYEVASPVLRILLRLPVFLVVYFCRIWIFVSGITCPLAELMLVKVYTLPGPVTTEFFFFYRS